MSVEVAGKRAFFVAVALGVVFLNLLPLGGHTDPVPAPDLLVCLVFAWLHRRPDVMSFWLIALVMLLADFLLMRPLGVWSLVVLFGSELMRRQMDPYEHVGLLQEILQVTVLIFVMIILERIALTLLASPRPPFLGHVLLGVFTAVFYPLVIFVSQSIFAIRRLSAQEFD